MIWEDSGKKRGYGYVEFSDDDAVDKVVLVRTHIINGRELESKKCLTKQQLRVSVKNLFGSNKRVPHIVISICFYDYCYVMNFKILTPKCRKVPEVVSPEVSRDQEKLLIQKLRL